MEYIVFVYCTAVGWHIRKVLKGRKFSRFHRKNIKIIQLRHAFSLSGGLQCWQQFNVGKKREPGYMSGHALSCHHAGQQVPEQIEYLPNPAAACWHGRISDEDMYLMTGPAGGL